MIIKANTNFFEIIDRRWGCQLHEPLHVAGRYLNPESSYDNLNLNLESDEEVMKGLYRVIAKFVLDTKV